MAAKNLDAKDMALLIGFKKASPFSIAPRDTVNSYLHALNTGSKCFLNLTKMTNLYKHPFGRYRALNQVPKYCLNSKFFEFTIR